MVHPKGKGRHSRYQGCPRVSLRQFIWRKAGIEASNVAEPEILREFLTIHTHHSNRITLIDCADVDARKPSLDVNAFTTIPDSPLIFYSLSFDLKRLLLHLVGNVNAVEISNDILLFGKSSGINKITAEEIRQEIDPRTRIHDVIADAFVPFPPGGPTRLPDSTPITASGIFNSRYIISSPENFSFITLALASKVRSYLNSGDANEALNSQGSNDFIFLSTTLRGAPFALALSQLFNSEAQIIASKRTVADPWQAAISSSKEGAVYLFVADFIIGGGELRVAEAYASLRRSSVVAAFVLGSLFSEETYRCGARIFSLVELGNFKDDRVRYDI
jgi:hypothetical protein